MGLFDGRRAALSSRIGNYTDGSVVIFLQNYTDRTRDRVIQSDTVIRKRFSKPRRWISHIIPSQSITPRHKTLPHPYPQLPPPSPIHAPTRPSSPLNKSADIDRHVDGRFHWNLGFEAGRPANHAPFVRLAGGRYHTLHLPSRPTLGEAHPPARARLSDVIRGQSPGDHLYTLIPRIYGVCVCGVCSSESLDGR